MEPGSHDPKKIMAGWARLLAQPKRPRPPSPDAETALSGATPRLELLRAAQDATHGRVWWQLVSAANWRAAEAQGWVTIDGVGDEHGARPKVVGKILERATG